MIINSKIIAHRGVHNNKDIPENSIKAFREALKYNYPIELDVQLTKDNVLVVFHDFDLKRMCGKCIRLQDINYSEIKDLKLLDTNEKIPTFKEVLDLIDGKVLLDIEVKDTKRIKDTFNKLILELGNYNNYILKSFNPLIVRYLKRKTKNIDVGLLITDHYDRRIYNKFLISKYSIIFSRADFIAISKKLLKNKKIISVMDKYPTLVWTIKNNDEIDYNNKIIYICNNLPFLNTKQD